ncbi:hypothetical protein [Micromonospora sp. NPDC005220]|uniref:hypothetical protein n=1 Tax=Micromonospora sp. NPDC005220 TaxID=3155589 RepID=UPI0033A99D6E
MALTRRELTDAVERAIGALAPVYRGAAAESDLYEAALLTIAVQASEAAGGTCLITNDGRTQSSLLTFRRSPGNLWLGDFTHVVVNFPDTPRRLEIHLGVYVVGGSKVPHECDVAVIDQEEAERSRQGLVHPRRPKLVASIEAKHYAASPGIGIGRAFIGLSAELGQAKCTLAFPARRSSSVAALLAARPSECFDELVPNGPAAQRLRSHLDQRIRNWIARG